VAQQQGSIDALLPLRWSINDRWKDALAAAAGNHVEASCIFRGGGGLDEGRLAWQEDGVAVNISFTLQSLIEEEDVSDADALQFTSHLRDLLTQIRRH